MSLPSPKSLLLIAGLLSFAGCGFQPIYHGDELGGLTMGQFDVVAAGDREGFVLEELLENRLGQAGSSPAYTLSVSLEVTQREIAISGAGGIDRFATEGTALFEVREQTDEPALYAGEVSGSASWTSNQATVGTSAAKLDAMDRMLTQIADRIVTRLIASSGSWSQ